MKVALSMLVLVMWVAVLSYRESTTPAPPKRHYCGRGLTTALTLLCNGYYNTVATLVTSTSTTLLTQKGRTRLRRKALMFLSQSLRRNRRGVYDECCRKSCSVEELSSYCGAS